MWLKETRDYDQKMPKSQITNLLMTQKEKDTSTCVKKQDAFTGKTKMIVRQEGFLEGTVQIILMCFQVLTDPSFSLFKQL